LVGELRAKALGVSSKEVCVSGILLLLAKHTPPFRMGQKWHNGKDKKNLGVMSSSAVPLSA
jgi:hypothetical protein